MATGSVACGVLGVGGNKGAVAVEFSLYRRKIALISSHFAAHQASAGCRVWPWWGSGTMGLDDFQGRGGDLPV